MKFDESDRICAGTLVLCGFIPILMIPPSLRGHLDSISAFDVLLVVFFVATCVGLMLGSLGVLIGLIEARNLAIGSGIAFLGIQTVAVLFDWVSISQPIPSDVFTIYIVYVAIVAACIGDLYRGRRNPVGWITACHLHTPRSITPEPADSQPQPMQADSPRQA